MKKSKFKTGQVVFDKDRVRYGRIDYWYEFDNDYDVDFGDLTANVAAYSLRRLTKKEISEK